MKTRTGRRAVDRSIPRAFVLFKVAKIQRNGQTAWVTESSAMISDEIDIDSFIGLNGNLYTRSNV